MMDCEGCDHSKTMPIPNSFLLRGLAHLYAYCKSVTCRFRTIPTESVLAVIDRPRFTSRWCDWCRMASNGL